MNQRLVNVMIECSKRIAGRREAAARLACDGETVVSAVNSAIAHEASDFWVIVWSALSDQEKEALKAWAPHHLDI